MLRPIPSKILTHTVTLRVASSVDKYQDATYTEQAVKRVCMQPTNDTRFAKDNTEHQLNSVLFVDARLSTPKLDWQALQDESQAAGTEMQVIYQGRTYTVVNIDALIDDTGRLHHYEVGLV